MDRALLVRAGKALFGENWVTPLAKLVGMRIRSMERMAKDQPVPDLREMLAGHCEERAAELTQIAADLRAGAP